MFVEWSGRIEVSPQIFEESGKGLACLHIYPARAVAGGMMDGSWPPDHVAVRSFREKATRVQLNLVVFARAPGLRAATEPTPAAVRAVERADDAARRAANASRDDTHAATHVASGADPHVVRASLRARAWPLRLGFRLGQSNLRSIVIDPCP